MNLSGIVLNLVAMYEPWWYGMTQYEHRWYGMYLGGMVWTQYKCKFQVVIKSLDARGRPRQPYIQFIPTLPTLFIPQSHHSIS